MTNRFCLHLSGRQALSFLALGITLVFASETNAQTSSKALLDRATCPAWIGDEIGERFDCGYVRVPENRQSANSRTIQVFFTRIGAYRDRPAAEPIVILAGGPGQPGSSVLRPAIKSLAPLRRDRDVIVVDQRGTGFSQPALDCRTDDGKSMVPPDCFNYYRQRTVDLSGYTTIQSALDLKDLRQALGLRQWNLVATSYGTRIALEAMRQDPKGIRSVVLNSPEKTGNNFFTEDNASNDKRAFEKLFVDCAADRDCAAAFPNLRQVFLDAIRKLDDAPHSIQTQGVTPNRRYLGFVRDVRSQLRDTSSIRYVPLRIWQRSQPASNLRPLEKLPLKPLSPSHATRYPAQGQGLFYSVLCHEDFSLIPSLPDLERKIATYEPFTPQRSFMDYMKRICAVWQVGQVNPRFADAVSSKIPTLILSGVYDTATPPFWADELATTLPNSQVFHFEGVGHDVIDTSGVCGQTLVWNFIEQPTRKLAADCVQRIGIPKFHVPPRRQ